MDASFWAPAITFSIVTLTIGTVLVLRGPVGKALGRWIESWSTPEHKAMEAKWAEAAAPGAPGEVARLRVEVDDLRRQLADVLERLDPTAVDDLHRQLGEVQERLDFTERLLTKQRDVERLGNPRS
jgi:hypothetical protein